MTRNGPPQPFCPGHGSTGPVREMLLQEEKICLVYLRLFCYDGRYVCIFFNDGTLGMLSGTFHIVFLRLCDSVELSRLEDFFFFCNLHCLLSRLISHAYFIE